MKQRIEVKVTIKNDKGRSKAMQIVAGIEGVSSVTLGGEDKNILIVIGDGVDAVTLTQALIKKLGGATLVRVVPLNEYGRFDDQEKKLQHPWFMLVNQIITGTIIMVNQDTAITILQYQGILLLTMINIISSLISGDSSYTRGGRMYVDSFLGM
ncbi:hypothetical protein ACET3Z_018413 [Daucus carota]